MLLATKTKEQYKEALAAVTHVDGTARVQSVLKEHDPFMHQLLESFKSLTGYSVLLNTSFNIAGDPIVESPHDAISAFLNCDLDLLVMENYLVIKSK
jgi:carbamoyltransferase